MLDVEVPIGRKLFEEIDKPIDSKVVLENKKEGITERESSWTGDIKGYNSFPSGKAVGCLHHLRINQHFYKMLCDLI